MKLLLSALLLAASTAGFSQAQTTQNPSGAAGIEGPGHLFEGPAVLLSGPSKSAACPLQLTAASLAPEASFLPVSQWNQGDGGLNLYFRNSSGREIRSASITAELRVKTNVYDLDAKAITLHLTFSGTDEIDKALDQLAHVPLPKEMYNYGVARVTLNQVIFADGALWVPRKNESCSVGGASSPELVDSK